MDTPVKISELPAKNGKRIGKIELNTPKTLNALSLEMVDLIAPVLQRWEFDQDIACVLLCGTGEKAFCAGGDIRSLYEGMVGEREASFCQDFFTREYQLDFHIHHYLKPLICWGSGFVIGGGIGLMSGCRYRVVTETSRLSMPEVSIGLYPDVAGSWFLNRMPGYIGLFLAFTGASLNSKDSLLTGMADYYLPSNSKDELLDGLVELQWADSVEQHHQQVHEALCLLNVKLSSELPESNFLPHFDAINRMLGGEQLSTKVDSLLNYQTTDPWFEKAQKALSKGSPSSVAIIDRQLSRSRYFSLAEVYQSELDLSMNCADDGDFAEGIRALLIDKDTQPKWRYASLEAVDENWLESMFQQRWDKASHPLRNLDQVR